MKTVPVPPMRATLRETSNELLVSIPQRRRTWLLIFLGPPAFLWFIGEMFFLNQLLGALFATPLLLLLFFAAWTALGIPLALPWLWIVNGKELIVVRPHWLTQRYELFPWLGRGRAYDLSRVRNLRVSPAGSDFGLFSVWLRMLHIGGGTIAFDYGSRTVRMGASVDEAEGSVIVERIAQHLPVPAAASKG